MSELKELRDLSEAIEQDNERRLHDLNLRNSIICTITADFLYQLRYEANSIRIIQHRWVNAYLHLRKNNFTT